ncbi:MAG TPA: hypothetical protein VI159_09475 [Gemmatimonadales bacterium]
MGRLAWLDAALAAGAIPASYVPDASGGRSEAEELTGADLVEGSELAVRALGTEPLAPSAVTFIDGIQRWAVVGYDGVVPIISAYVAAAARRRTGGRLQTVAEQSRRVVITAVDGLSDNVRDALQRSGEELITLKDEVLGQPGRALTAAGIQVERLRDAVERAVAEPLAERLPADEWLVIDGILSNSAVLASHARTLGVIKSHGAQYFSGDDLRRALTLPQGHRTSVFQPHRHGSQAVYSWYVRIWPWEGHDLLYGLLRLEARAHRDSIGLADALGSWLLNERKPLSTPDARFDRLLYPIHDVETYLRSRAPQYLVTDPGSRLPRTVGAGS